MHFWGSGAGSVCFWTSQIRIHYYEIRIRILLSSRSCRLVGASDSQCRNRNCPGFRFDPSILWHSGIWGAADEAVLSIIHKKKKILKIPFYRQAKIERKASIPPVLWYLCDFLSLINDVNVASKSSKQKDLKKKFFFFFLAVSWRSLTKIVGSGAGSVPKCHGSATLLVCFHRYHYSNIHSKYTKLHLLLCYNFLYVQDGCEDGVRYLLKFTSSADPAIGTDHKLR
jgi:hypothetical protein